MRRKLIMAAMAVMLPIGFLATIGTGVAAAKGSSEIDGNISYNLSGTVSIKPAITATSVGPYTVTFKGKNGDCTALAGPTPSPFISLLTSTEALTFTVPVANPPVMGCATLLSGGATAVPASTIKWKAKGYKVDTTDLGPSSAVTTPGSPDSTITLTGDVTSGWSETATFSITLSANTTTLANDCASKKGLSKFAVTDGSGDNLEIGPAF
jgi:hypothetical protein